MKNLVFQIWIFGYKTGKISLTLTDGDKTETALKKYVKQK